MTTARKETTRLVLALAVGTVVQTFLVGMCPKVVAEPSKGLGTNGIAGQPKPSAEDQSAQSEERQPSKRVAIIEAEDAFRLALGALKWRFDLVETNGLIRFQRSEHEGWTIRITRYSDIPNEGLLVTVQDTEDIQVRLARNDASAEAWLAFAKTNIYLRPRTLPPAVAFRKGISVLTRWHLKRTALLETRGRIYFRRYENYWHMNVAGYSGLALAGLSVTIADDGKVEVDNMF